MFNYIFISFWIIQHTKYATNKPIKIIIVKIILVYWIFYGLSASLEVSFDYVKTVLKGRGLNWFDKVRPLTAERIFDSEGKWVRMRLGVN